MRWNNDNDVIRQREEITDQYKALAGMRRWQLLMVMTFHSLQRMQRSMPVVILRYLAAIRTQNGAAMSVGRVSTFLDIDIQRDLDNGVIQKKKLRN